MNLYLFTKIALNYFGWKNWEWVEVYDIIYSE